VTSEKRSGQDGLKLTIETAYDGLLVNALLDYDFDVRVCSGDGLEVVDEEGAGGVGRGPGVAELEDEFADLGDEYRVAVGGLGCAQGVERHCRSRGVLEGRVACRAERDQSDFKPRRAPRPSFIVLTKL